MQISGGGVPKIWRGSNPPSVLHPPVASSPPSQWRDEQTGEPEWLTGMVHNLVTEREREGVYFLK